MKVMPATRPPPDTAAEAASLLRATTGGHRKKSACVRSWLQVDSGGQEQVMEAGKHEIMRRTGLPARDLRILDPVLSYPSTVLGRERAIVVNLEHIKTIITAQEVLFLNSSDPLLTPFVKNLRNIILHRQSLKREAEGEADGNNEVLANFYNPEEPQPLAVSSGELESDTAVKGFPDRANNGQVNQQQAAENARGLKLLPFEFVALEACLDTACCSLDNEARRLEQEAHPALDKLTSKISTLNLERVRQIKSRLVAITGRVQKVRDELEHLLDDDKDMAEMYLTDKLEQQHLANFCTSSISGLDDLSEEVILPDEDTRISDEIVMRPENGSLMDIPENKQIIIDEPTSLRRDGHQTAITSPSSDIKRLDVVELEMILEAYFVQIEGTLNKLSTLKEYVDDTEDYINIMLDDKQNHLLQMEVMLSTASVVVNAYLALAGVFGMNITIDLFDETKAGMPEFLWTVGGGAIASVVMYVAAIAWYKYNKILQ